MAWKPSTPINHEAVHAAWPGKFSVDDDAGLILNDGYDTYPTQAEYDAAVIAWNDAADDRAWEVIRTERNTRLTACDWTILPDTPLTSEQQTAWQTYRQALRDLPQTYATPAAVVWPETPA